MVAGNTERLAIGHSDPLYDFDGFIDEVQISNIDRSADWIAAQFKATKNQFGEEFIQFGGEQVAPVLGGVLGNDTDVDGNALRAVMVSGPAHGSLNLNADGTFSYTPDANWTGTDSFTYKAIDGMLDGNVATVSIVVNPVNDAPVNTVPGPQTTPEDTALEFSSANDNAISVADVDAAGNEIEVTLTVTNGTLSLNLGGPLGGEFLVNSTTADSQGLADLAVAPDGSYVVVWQSYNQDGGDMGIYLQRFAADGTALGSETLVNTTTANWQQNPAIAMDSSGNFVVVWDSYPGQDGAWYGVYGQRFNASGTKVGGEFLVNTTTGSDQRAPDVAMDAGGGFVVVWEGNGTGDTYGVFVQRFDAAGVKQGSETLINTSTTGQQKQASIAIDGSGKFVVAWYNANDQQVYARRYDAAGTPLSSEFVVNTTSAGIQWHPSVGMNATGQFVIAWRDEVGKNIFAQRYDAAGSAQGGEFQVNIDVDNESDPQVAVYSDGGFAISFTRTVGTNSDVYVRRYDSNGNTVGAEVRVNATTASNQMNDSIAMLPSGDFLVAWQGYSPGDTSGILTRRLGDTVSNLSFSGGDGIDDSSMTFTGTPADINTVLDGLIYTPNANFNGSDTLTITTNDLGNTGSGGALSDVDTVSINVIAVNDAPLLDNSGTMTVTTITEDETDNAGNTVAEIIASAGGDRITDPNAGAVEGIAITGLLNGNGTWQYSINAGASWLNVGAVSDNSALLLRSTDKLRFVPDALNADSASVTFRAWDQTSGSAGTKVDASVNGGSTAFSTATESASITVTAVNDAPIAAADSFTVNEASTTNLNLADNDSDADDGLDLTSINIVSGPTNGSIVVNADGTVDYTHDGSETVADSFTYTIDDLSGATSNTVTVNLTVTPVNDAPIAAADSFTVYEGSTTILNLAANDTDADDGLDLTSINIVSGPSNGSIVVNADGTVDYTHDGSETVADSFTYTIDDLSGVTSNTVTVNLTITPVNDAPIAAADSYTVNEGSTTTLNLASNDSDADDGLDLTSITIVSGPSNGSIVVNADGTVDYTHDGSETIADSFTYTIDDLSGVTSNTVTVNLTITPVNDVPIAAADSFTVNEGSTTNLNLAANDTDVDDGLDLTSINIVSGTSNGSIVVNADGTVDYTHDGSETVADSFTYTIDDLSGVTSNTVTVNLTITPVNDAPIAAADSFTVIEGSTTNLNLAANDTDVDDGLDLTSITIVSGPTNGSIVVNADGTVDYTHDGSETVADNFTYTIDDLSGVTSNTVIVNLTVSPVNDDPIATADSFTVNEGITTNLNLAANDSDADDGLDLSSIAIVSGPTNGSIVVNADGTVDYTHDGSETVADSFTYTIDDLAGATSNTVTVNLTVTPVNDAPIATADSFTVNEGSTTTPEPGRQ